MATQTGRRGDVRRRNRSIDGWCNIWRRKASALGGSARITCRIWLDRDFSGWYGLKHPVVSWYVEARNGVSLTAAGTVSATNQAKWHRKSGAEERGSSPPHPPPFLPPPSPSGGVCWVRSRQFGLNNHRPFLHQRRLHATRTVTAI